MSRFIHLAVLNVQDGHATPTRSMAATCLHRRGMYIYFQYIFFNVYVLLYCLFECTFCHFLLIYMKLHPNCFFRFCLPRGSFFYLSGDGEWGRGLFWDYFETIWGPFYMFLIYILIKSMKTINNFVFDLSASWQFGFT